MGSPGDLNLEYRSSKRRKKGEFRMNGFVGKERGSLEERLQCLEEERRKVDAFRRELPLCMELVNDGKAAVRKEPSDYSGICTHQKILAERGEERRRVDDEGEGLRRRDELDALGSVVWIDNHIDSDIRNETTEDESLASENSYCLSVNPRRGSSLRFKRGLLLFEEEDFSPDLSLSTQSTPSCGAESSSPVQSATQPPLQRKARRRWSPELHRRFLNSLQQLGGAQVAIPKQIRESMKVDGLTSDEVKSHLQKYRLHTRRMAVVVASGSLAARKHRNSLSLTGHVWMPHEFPSSLEGAGRKQAPVQLASPQRPLQLSAQNHITNTDNLEEDRDADEEEIK